VGRLADLDAVTLDANGTLIGLVDPVPKLDRLLREQGIEREPEIIRRAFEAEGVVYAGRAAEAHEPATLATMQRECTSVFLEEAGVELDPAEFAPRYVSAMEFEMLPGVVETLRVLRRCGLELAVVANFDLTLGRRLGELGLRPWFSAVVTPAEAGAPKPDPAIFELAVSRLEVSAARVLHVGDGEVDEAGAAAAGLHFEWAPLPDAVARWT
jgi:HAD superfamily hydrolase (TIGR01509 family)